MSGWAIGFMVGIGAFHGPWRWLLGHDQTHEDETFLAGKDQGVGRYFRFTTDHKVVGIQYLVVTMVLLGVGGTLAMMIRTDLITPDSRFLGPQTYNSVVGLHGLIMIIATIIMVTGPFGNFIVPIMIGARDMAFPRLNALSLWLLVALRPGAVLGGVPRRHPDRLVRLRPAVGPGAARHGRLPDGDHHLRDLQRRSPARTSPRRSSRCARAA